MARPSESELRVENDELRAENEELRLRLEEAEQALEAIRTGQVESLVIDGPGGPRIFSLEGATHSYRVLVESMNEGAVTLTEDGVVLYCNGRFAGMLGQPLQKLMGSSVREHVPERFRAALDDLLDRARASGVRQEIPLCACDGGEIPVYLSASAIVDAGKRVLCLVATDLREQKRTEAIAAAEQAARESEERLRLTLEELRESDRRKDEFLRMLSHELRNPLAPIRNSTHLLRYADPGSEQARRAQGVIERQTQHLTRLVDDLLDVTRIASGKIDLRRERVDLREVVRRTAEDFRSVIEGRGATFAVDVPDGKVWADVDETRVGQAIGNLLHNAAKFTRGGESVTLSLEAAGTDARVRVRDTGAGIDAALLPHVFDPFVQGERTLARTAGGLGLGLALVKGIVQLHGGQVSARSEGIGRGAEFLVSLPLTVPSSRKDRPAETTTRHPSGRRVLVVDDNVDAAESLAETLKLSGHEVEVAFDGPAAIDKVRLHRPDVVLCDIGLPGMSGYEVARTLRASGANTMQLIAVSGYAQPGDVKKSIDAGFDAHVAKPCDPQQIERLFT
ncbi:MAG TPA: ATP-binding protein [Anaeromyxobacteraceae bacterium]|nr:ATP-binding protein [Anaeromyxobacteraceae bacterium]